MSPELITILMFSGVLIGVVFLGFPVAFTLGGLGFVFGMVFMGPDSMSTFLLRLLGAMKENILLAVPLFVLMGAVMERSGMAESLYEAMHIWLGGLRGGLAIATILICTAFAAATGVVGASVVTMGLIALPAMVKRGYHKPLAAGTVIAGGTLGIIIPPSIMLVVMAPLGGMSLGKLYMAAEIPGLMLSAAFIAYVAVLCGFNPKYGPPLPKEERIMPLGNKLVLLIANLIPPIFLIFAVLGAIFFGVTSPTEAAATGVVVVLCYAAIYRKLTWQNLKGALLRTTVTSGFILFIIIGAMSFATLLAQMRIPRELSSALTESGASPLMVFVGVVILYFILGMFMEGVSIMTLTIPIVVPVMAAMGYDLIWFGVIVTLLVELALITPPVGVNCFVIAGIGKTLGVTLEETFKGIMPYIVIMLIGVGLFLAYPQTATWLPSAMK